MELAKRGFDAWKEGDFDTIESLLAPQVRWNWYEPGEWDCNNREDVMGTIRERYKQGFVRGELEFVDGGDDIIVIARPREIAGPDWPEETATVMTFHDGKVTVMQDYRTKQEALGCDPVDMITCDEVLRGMPEATLAVRRTAFGSLVTGQALSIDATATIAGLASETAREAAQLIASVGMAELEGETIVGIDGLTTRPTDHRILLGDVALWTWCAYDIVGIAAALAADAIGRTPCGACGQRIQVVVSEGRPEPGTAIGWLPQETCSNIMAEFCPSALLFCSKEHLDEWRSDMGAGSGEALDIQSLAERGRIAWRDLVP